MEFLTEDKVRDDIAKPALGFNDEEKDVQQGTGQITTFNKLGFKGNNKKPDGWYLPNTKSLPAIILETKASNIDLMQQKWVDELMQNVDIANTQYKNVVGILYNGYDIRIFKNHNELSGLSNRLENKTYYLKLYTGTGIDKSLIYSLTKHINDNLHVNFGIKNLNHRMIFTACALVAVKEGAMLVPGMEYNLFHQSILNSINKALTKAPIRNAKLNLLSEQYSLIQMNRADNQDAIDDFIDCVKQISDYVNSDNWNGEDVMGIFFNEFNRYKAKSEAGQVFTPDHITSFIYRILDVHYQDKILDATCGSGAFLVKAMSEMIKESGGRGTEESKKIMSERLYGIEFDKEIYALACANMLIHKDGKTNLEQMDTRSEEACNWIRSKQITKVLMNPPYERKYGCMKIVSNVLDNVPIGTKCAFILPDKKLEKNGGKKLLKNHHLVKIIKLPENLFFGVGVTTSIFIFEAGIPQNGQEIFACYMEDDGLETVKNQGRHDIKGKWTDIEEYWVDVIRKQRDDKYHTDQWIKPDEHLSYQVPEKPFELSEEDFIKTTMDYLMFEQGLDVKEFKDKLLTKAMYAADVEESGEKIKISFEKDENYED